MRPTALAEFMPRASTSGLQLIADMLLYDPHRRPTASESLQHEWFKNLWSSDLARNTVSAPIGEQYPQQQPQRQQVQQVQSPGVVSQSYRQAGKGGEPTPPHTVERGGGSIHAATGKGYVYRNSSIDSMDHRRGDDDSSHYYQQQHQQQQQPRAGSPMSISRAAPPSHKPQRRTSDLDDHLRDGVGMELDLPSISTTSPHYGRANPSKVTETPLPDVHESITLRHHAQQQDEGGGSFSKSQKALPGIGSINTNTAAYVSATSPISPPQPSIPHQQQITSPPQPVSHPPAPDRRIEDMSIEILFREIEEATDDGHYNKRGGKRGKAQAPTHPSMPFIYQNVPSPEPRQPYFEASAVVPVPAGGRKEELSSPGGGGVKRSNILNPPPPPQMTSQYHHHRLNQTNVGGGGGGGNSGLNGRSSLHRSGQNIKASSPPPPVPEDHHHGHPSHRDQHHHLSPIGLFQGLFMSKASKKEKELQQMQLAQQQQSLAIKGSKSNLEAGPQYIKQSNTNIARRNSRRELMQSPSPTNNNRSYAPQQQQGHRGSLAGGGGGNNNMSGHGNSNSNIMNSSSKPSIFGGGFSRLVPSNIAIPGVILRCRTSGAQQDPLYMGVASPGGGAGGGAGGGNNNSNSNYYRGGGGNGRLSQSPPPFNVSRNG
ncbi:hypothetical protein HDU76_008752, partial [Blyttiomyces sp. JEL0837]